MTWNYLPAAALHAARDGEDVSSALMPEITDEALIKKIIAKNLEIRNAPAIRHLIERYATDAGWARDIPQSSRLAFLAKLDALTNYSS